MSTPVVNTPYQQIKNSAPGRFVRDNKVTTAGGVLGSALVIAGGAAKSEGFRQIAQKAIIPAAGAGLAVVGGSMVHDAIANDFGKGHNGRGVGKTFTGAVMALGGTEIVGRSFDIPVANRALSKPAQVAGDAINGLFGKHWKAIGGGALVAGGAGLLGTSVYDATNNGLKERNVLGATAGATLTTGGVATLASVAGAKTLVTSVGKATEAMAGVTVGAFGITRGIAAFNSAKEGSIWGTVANGTLAATATAGGAMLFGHAIGNQTIVKAGERLFTPIGEHVLQPAGKFLLENPVIGGAIVLGGVGAAAHYYFNKDKK